MNDFPGLIVEPGEVRLNYALLVVDDEHAKVWEIDMHSKYAEVLSCSYDDLGRPQVLTHGTEDSLKLDEEMRRMPTRITATSLDESWSILAQAARYTLRIMMYRRDHSIAKPS